MSVKPAAHGLLYDSHKKIVLKIVNFNLIEFT